MILNSQRTIYGINLQFNLLTQKPHKELINTTLNEKFNVIPQYPIPIGIYPKLQYYAIGIGGTDIIDNTSYKYSKHRSIDGALFQHIPFVVREVTADLNSLERTRYRFRVTQNINGIEYALYYLKVIPKIINRDGLFEVETKNGISKLQYMDTNRSDILNPVPRIVENYLDPSKNVYIAKTIKTEFSLYADEMAEIKAGIDLLGFTGNITEIAVCSGIDVETTDENEASNVVVNYFVEVDINTTLYINTTTDFIRNIELAGVEAMTL